ncbi:MAG: glycosyltransferase family 4 protein, partial [Endomicrobiales bacterium]
DPFGFYRLWKIVQKENIGILHAHQGKVFWPCIFMKWLKGPKLKVVFHRHAQLPHRFYSRGHYRSADRVIAISKAVADGLRRGEKVPAEKIRVIYNGTDFSRFSASVPGDEVRRKYGLENKVVIGTVAAMNRPRGKGQEYLIEAAQILKARSPQAVYLIVGTGPIESELKELARRLGVSDRVIFAGYQEDVENYLAAMDIFCFLSWDTEGFGQVMVEAQAMGKPVIGTDIGGIPETFTDNSTGFLIRPRDCELLAQMISVLLNNEGMRREMGASAARSVRERFSLEGMIDGVTGVYRELED